MVVVLGLASFTYRDAFKLYPRRHKSKVSFLFKAEYWQHFIYSLCYISTP